MKVKRARLAQFGHEDIEGREEDVDKDQEHCNEEAEEQSHPGIGPIHLLVYILIAMSSIGITWMVSPIACASG